MTKRVCILPGGASYGAEVVGIFSALKPKYDVWIGSSTGALASLLLACGKYTEAIEAYSTTTNREMYGWLMNPFKKDGSVNKVKLVLQFANMLRKDQLYAYDIGTPLLKKIRKYFKPEDFDRLRDTKTEIIITAKCIDIRKRSTEYVTNLEANMYYEKFIKYVAASASIPFFAAPQSINGLRFVDGGTLDPIPTGWINTRFLHDQIDIYLMHSKRSQEEEYDAVTGPVDLFIRLAEDHREEIKRDDLAKIRNKATRILYSTYKDTPSANFDPELMKLWIQWGINRVQHNRIDFEKL